MILGRTSRHLRLVEASRTHRPTGWALAFVGFSSGAERRWATSEGPTMRGVLGPRTVFEVVDVQILHVTGAEHSS